MEKWWERPGRKMHIMYLSGEYKKGIDIQKAVDLEKEIHTNACWFAGTPALMGDSYKVAFNSDYFKKMEGIGERDLLKEYCTLARKKGIRPIIYLNMHWYSNEFGKGHRDWEQVLADGTTIGKARPLYGSGTSFCVNSQWRDWSYRLIKEVASYDIDGIFLDGPVIFLDYCYCQYCQKKFKEIYKRKELPREEDWSNPIWKEFIEFRYQSMADYLRDARGAIKEVNPEAIIYINSGGWTSERTPRDIQLLSDYQDINGAEAFYGGNFPYPLWHPGYVAKYMSSMGKPAEVFLTYSHKPWQHISHTPLELKTSIAQVAANGANPWIECVNSVITHDPTGLKPIKEIFGFLEKNEGYYTKTSSKANVALLLSQQNKAYYFSQLEGVYESIASHEEKDLQIDMKTKKQVDWKGRKDICDEFLNDSFKGFYEVLARTHIPFDIIVDKTLTKKDLSKYDTLIFPNIPCLSDTQVEVVKEFVKKGGGLIATFETSCYDEKGNSRNKFAFRDLINVERLKGLLPPSTMDMMIVKDKNHFITKGFIYDQYLARPNYCLSVLAKDGVEVPIRAMKPLDSCYADIKGESDEPMLMISSYGKGRVVYFPSLIGATYYKFKIPTHQKLLENSIRWVIRENLPIQVDAPESVVVEVREQPENKRTMIHLINLTGEMRRPFNKIIPINDIRIRVKGEKPKRVYTLNSKEELSFQEKSDGIEFLLPCLDIYEVIVCER